MNKDISRSTFLVILVTCWITTATLGSTDALAAQWLAPAAADRITADWVQQIEADLTGDRFKDVFMGMSANTPIPAVLHMLNNAAKALADGKKEYAQSFIDRAVEILDSGVSKGWYGRGDIEPVKGMIIMRAEAALNGKSTTHAANPRWSGYSDNTPLGLSNAPGSKQESYAVETVPSSDGQAANR